MEIITEKQQQEQQNIIGSTIGLDAFNFAQHIPCVDIDGLQQVVLEQGAGCDILSVDVAGLQKYLTSGLQWFQPDQ